MYTNEMAIAKLEEMGKNIVKILAENIFLDKQLC